MAIMWRLVLLLSALAVAQDSTVTVEGTVIDAATKAPIAGAQVALQSAHSAPDVSTDASGGFRFEVPELAPHTLLVVKRPGYRDVSRKAESGPMTIRLTPLGQIEGQVLDENGHPMEGVLLYSGINMLAETDKEGRYQIRDLAPGDYKLYCRITFEARKKLLEKDEKTGEVRGYADTYYFPGFPDAERGMKTTLGGGMHLTGVDFRLRRGPLVGFSGRVVERSGGEPLKDASVELDRGFLLDETRKRRNVEANGGFRFELIEPGHYTLLVYRGAAADPAARRRAGPSPLPAGDPGAFHVPVDIGPGGLTDAELRIPENVEITIRTMSPHPERTTGGVMVAVGPFITGAPRPGFSMRPPCWTGKTCTLADIPPGEWAFDVQAPGVRESGDSPRFLYIESIRFGQQDAWNRPVTIAEGGNPPLEIVLTGDVGTIQATVTGEDGKPLSGMVVAQRLGGTEPMRNSTTGRLEGLLPGDYEVAGFARDEDTGRVAYGSPERCSDQAVKVAVRAGQTTMVNLKPCVFDRQ